VKRYYPVGLDLAGKDVLVVGGGKVAEGKIDQLLESEARVRLVSPTATPRIAALAAQGLIDWQQRPYRPGDVADAWIVIAAADDRSANAVVAQDARAAGRLVNAVDDVPNCDFIAMSIVKKGELQVAISTGGGSPAMARWMREELERLLPDELGALLDALAEIRLELKATGHIPPYDVWRRAMTPAVLDLLKAGRHEEARDALRAALSGERATGVVYLVGAGPGDPGLLTQRGAALLRLADVVLHDRLVDPAVLKLARPEAELVDVGKAPRGRSTPQEEINRLLIHHAREGKTVVRLKGGDPFVFGRGGEEAIALDEAGIRFEVVPGISSAVAAAAYAGIPVTHRGISSAVTVVAGHGASDDRPVADALAAYAGTPHPGTLVVLMGLGRLDWIVATLLRSGCRPDTPVALVQAASGAGQRSLVADLASIVQQAQEAGIAAPATLVVGEVVRLRDRIAWREEADTFVKELVWS
jgi:uroporphyrin-III C-methyltransferase/precorrin-2 dehydrogenase/sirohydrochlorin ferrochelatase